MATLVMTAAPILLTGEKTPGGGKYHIDISGLEEEAYEDACNQVLCAFI